VLAHNNESRGLSFKMTLPAHLAMMSGNGNCNSAANNYEQQYNDELQELVAIIIIIMGMFILLQRECISLCNHIWSKTLRVQCFDKI
jgi:hypothetical protein